MTEAKDHRHIRARSTFVEVDGVSQPAPAPRFDVTPTDVPGPPVLPGNDTDAVLELLGYHPEEIGSLRERSVVA